MSEKLRKLIQEAQSLSLEERAELAGSLLLSLDEPFGAEVERLLLQKAEHRLREFRKGKVEGFPAESVRPRPRGYLVKAGW